MKLKVLLLIASLLFSFAGKAQKNAFQWGLDAGIGHAFNYIGNEFKGDFFHYPIGFAYHIGGAAKYEWHAKHHIILSTSYKADFNKVNAEKYNNTWTTFNFKRHKVHLEASYRKLFGASNAFWLQAGINVGLVLNSGFLNYTTTKHNNDNNVREVLTTIYTGEINRFQPQFIFKVGHFLDKQHQHELCFNFGLDFFLFYKKGYEGFSRHSFTFSDGSTANYQASLNGNINIITVQYGFWF